MFESASVDDDRVMAARRLAAAVELPPGPVAMGVLSGVDADALGIDDRVTLLQAWERCSRWVAAQQAKAVVAVAGPRPSDHDDFARELVRVALLGCGGSPRSNVELARALAGPLTVARDALERGDMSWDHARVLAQETEPLDPATAREVAEGMLARAERSSPGEFRRAARRAVIAADPVRAELAAQRAAEARHVSRRAEPDAQASLFFTGPAADVQTVWTALDLRAAHVAAGDTRTLDQRRFDALVEICRAASAPTGGAAGGMVRTRVGLRPAVYLFADAATWAGLGDEPVDLDGYGPIPAGVAREYFSDATWRAVVTDALGRVQSVSDAGYSPSARTRRHLHVQDRRCGFPACGAAVWFCDADHNTPHAEGGCTDPDNCGLFCRRHHRLKTFTRWTWRRLPDGTLEWVDPQGRPWYRPPIRYEMPRKPEPEPVPEPEPAVAPQPAAAPVPAGPPESPGDVAPPF